VLEDKLGELRRMETRARQFPGDVSHELRTPLTAMTTVLGEYTNLTGDATMAARLAVSRRSPSAQCRRRR